MAEQQNSKSTYSGGRSLSGAEIRQLFEETRDKAAVLHAQYAGQIQQRSHTKQLLNLIRGQ